VPEQPVVLSSMTDCDRTTLSISLTSWTGAAVRPPVQRWKATPSSACARVCCPGFRGSVVLYFVLVLGVCGAWGARRSHGYRDEATAGLVEGWS
jgi:hypothetical protein